MSIRLSTRKRWTADVLFETQFDTRDYYYNLLSQSNFWLKIGQQCALSDWVGNPQLHAQQGRGIPVLTSSPSQTYLPHGHWSQTTSDIPGDRQCLRLESALQCLFLDVNLFCVNPSSKRDHIPSASLQFSDTLVYVITSCGATASESPMSCKWQQYSQLFCTGHSTQTAPSLKYFTVTSTQGQANQRKRTLQADVLGSLFM
jgi:hypothetical protein